MLPYRSSNYLYSGLAPPAIADYNPIDAGEQWKANSRPSSPSSDSILSDLAKEEDDFGRLMIANLRAEKRLQDILAGKRVQPFSKASKWQGPRLTSESLTRRQPVQAAYNPSQQVENWMRSADDSMASANEAPIEPENDVPFGHVFRQTSNRARSVLDSAASGDADNELDTTRGMENVGIHSPDMQTPFQVDDDMHSSPTAPQNEDSWPSKLDVGTPAPGRYETAPCTPPPPSSDSAKSATESLKRRILEMGAPRPLVPTRTPRVTPTQIKASESPKKPETPIKASLPKVENEPRIEEPPKTINKAPKREDPTDTLRALSKVFKAKASRAVELEAPREGPKPRNLPTSALARIVADAKTRGNSTQNDHTAYGDSTIDSLEGVAFPTLRGDASSLSPTETVDIHGSPVYYPPQRVHEMDQLTTMNARLRATRSSIKDANKGMRRLETDVPVAKSDGKACKPCFCHECNQKAHDGPRQTGPLWLVLSLLLLFVWYVLETTLCHYYCQPAFAQTMIGFGVDAEAPEVPFVTLTLASRPFLWLLRRLF